MSLYVPGVAADTWDVFLAPTNQATAHASQNACLQFKGVP